MQPQIEWGLCGWSMLAAVWWLIAWRLAKPHDSGVFPAFVERRRRSAALQDAYAQAKGDQQRDNVLECGGPPPLFVQSPTPCGSREPSLTTASLRLSLFKPVPTLNCPAPPPLVTALESWIVQLDEGDELVLGLDLGDQKCWEPIVAAWRERYPRLRIEVVFAPQPTHFPNPKISWEHTLSRHARGEFWLWSDADIIAPQGALAALRSTLAKSDAELVTAPYVIRDVPANAALVEALYVNMELYPGARLLARQKEPGCAFGSCLLFRAETFRARVTWKRLGSVLAEDFEMASTLKPVAIAPITLESLAQESRWRHAIGRYLRWHKGVRWCRPAGYAGQLIILPLLGWGVFALSHPFMWTAWVGLLATMQLEAFAAWLILRRIGFRFRLQHFGGIELWCLLRPLVWLACWFPWPVVWRPQRRRWWAFDRSVER